MASLRELPLIQKLTARYDQLSRRDQQAVMVLGLAVLLAVLYLAIWKPAADFRERATASRDNAIALVAWMASNEESLQRLAEDRRRGRTAAAPEDGRQLMSLVTGSARQAGLSLQRFEPSGDNAMRVWIEDAPFNQVARWLEELATGHGITIDQASVDRAGNPGQVGVRLTLQI